MKTNGLFKNKKIIDDVINGNLIYVALLTLPLTYIVFLALADNNVFFVKAIIPILSFFTFLLLIFRKKIPFQLKIWLINIDLFLISIVLFFFGIYELSVFWFVVSTTYIMYVFEKKKRIYFFGMLLALLLFATFFMFADTNFVPKTPITLCYKQCMIARFVKYILVGLLVVSILSRFMKEFKMNIDKLKEQADDLTIMNQILTNEIKEKKRIQHKALGEIILAEERERKRIAADLHDGLGPVMSSINLYYQAYIDEKNPQKKKEIELRLKNIIHDAIADVSKISHNISPHIVENNGLVVALQNFIDQINMHEKIDIILKHDNIFRFDIKKELTIYRAVTELINNTLKYANADYIHIQIYVKDKQLYVKYADNGIGFDIHKQNESKSGIGLYNITNRLESLRGKFIYETSPKLGFKAELIIPYS